MGRDRKGGREGTTEECICISLSREEVNEWKWESE
jgi:hypothetical protein